MNADDFLWTRDSKRVTLRDRSGLEALERRIEYIAPEEVDLAIQEILEKTHGVENEEVARLVARSLGLGRTGSEVRDAIDARLRRAISAGTVEQVGAYLQATDR